MFTFGVGLVLFFFFADYRKPGCTMVTCNHKGLTVMHSKLGCCLFYGFLNNGQLACKMYWLFTSGKEETALIMVLNVIQCFFFIFSDACPLVVKSLVNCGYCRQIRPCNINM